MFSSKLSKFIIVLNVKLMLVFTVCYASEEELSVKVYGYPTKHDQTYKVSNFNPLQPENLSLIAPGLTIAKLGSFGQKTSVRFNAFSSGDLTFLFDGFEISDMSDPAEGFDISSFLMMPDFTFNFSSNSSGLFSRQSGGVLSIDSSQFTKSYLHSGFGSHGQSLLSVQKSFCSNSQCLSLGLGGTYAEGESASFVKTPSRSLEKDSAGLGFLSLGWQKHLSGDKILKVRGYSQLSRVDIDDYDSSFVFRDDPNANLNQRNHFLGVSFAAENHQVYFENTFSDREIANDADNFNPSSRYETYQVFKSKLRGAHQITSQNFFLLKNTEFFWYTQRVDLQTTQINSEAPEQQRDLQRWEAGLQFDKKAKFENLEGVTSLSFNGLEGFKTSGGVSQSFEAITFEQKNSQTFLQTHFGFKERRPSFFQLFDPQFGDSNLQNEKQFYFRPQIKWVKTDNRKKKHNISLEYFYENIDSRVVFLWDESNGVTNYQNTGHLKSNSLIAEYGYQGDQLSGRFFFRQSMDSELTRISLPWMAKQELGVGSQFYTKLFGRPVAVSADFKWLLDMFGPTGKHIGNLVQSQSSLSYQFGMNDRVSLQLNNVFNDKKIWDEGVQRQSFSWMLSLTKFI